MQGLGAVREASMLTEIRHHHDCVYAAITHDSSGKGHLVRTHARGRLADVFSATLALWFCTPVYAADAAEVGKEAVASDAHDIALTADIRKAVLADKSLGVNAQNVKVIIKNGRVTLRGPVDSSAERTRIVEIAQRIAGLANVTNKIELTSP